MDPILLAQNYDGNKSEPYQQITVRESTREQMNGGTPAVLSWALPLIVALVMAIYLWMLRRRTV